MVVYYINLALILGLAWPLCIYKPNKAKKIAYLAVTFGYMWFLMTFRTSDVGFDYSIYIKIFNQVGDAATLRDVFTLDFEPGFLLLNYLLKPFVYNMHYWLGDAFPSAAEVTLYGVYATLVFVPMAIFIYQHCKTAWLSVWLYVTLAYFYMSMNFVRACIACGITLLGYQFLKERRPIPYFAIILLAATFHRTALIMIPLYFMTLIPLNKYTVAGYGALNVAGFITAPWLVNFGTNFFMKSYQDSIYVKNTLSPVFMIVPTVILIACIALYPVWKKRDPAAKTLLYMMLFCWSIWLAGTRVFILERFCHYAYLLALVALPSALESLKASPEIHEKLAAFERKGGKDKAVHHEITQLRQTIKDHNQYYMAAVVAVLIITCLYNEFGMHTNNFHGVFPYYSLLW